MFRATNSLVAGLLLCLLVNYISAVEEGCDTLRYELILNKVIRLEPDGIKANIRLTTEVLVQPENKQGNILGISLRNTDYTVQKENGQIISLSKCSANAALDKSIAQPFVATFDENGLLRDIRITKKESAFAVNLKLFGASLLQINLPQLRGQVPPVAERQELTTAGICPVIDKVKQVSWKVAEFQRVANFARCTECLQDRRNDGISCRKNTCRHAPERNFKWTGEADTIVKEVNGCPVVNRLTVNEIISYSPFKGRKTELTANINFQAVLKSVGKEKRLLDNDEVDLITRPRYLAVNKDICLKENHKVDGDLGEIYSALTCQQSFSNLYQEIIERAIVCSKREW